MAKPTKADVQNAYYSGWLHSVLVTGVLCFGADGAIVFAKHNCPGSWNDGDTCMEFLLSLLDKDLCPDQLMGVVSDSAFPCSKEVHGRIMTPLKDGELEALPIQAHIGAQRLNAASLRTRQAAEWGVGSIEKVYGRLQCLLPFRPEQRAVRLENIFRLSNYRVRTTGISQIANSFRCRCDVCSQ